MASALALGDGRMDMAEKVRGPVAVPPVAACSRSSTRLAREGRPASIGDVGTIVPI
jgi:hypothetical protein